MPGRGIGIAGLGLIGGSIAAALRAAGLGVHVVGVDRPEVVDEARRRGWVDEGRPSVTDLTDVDLIVLATPVPAIVSLIGELGRAGLRVPVTDVGSTKRTILDTAGRTGLSFVGGHPMTGSDASGLAHARADLFQGRTWFVVPGDAAPEAVALVDLLAAQVGAEPLHVDAESHDRAMAYVSHLPQLLAVALADAAGSAVGAEGLSMAGRAFGEMTRLASSSPALWQGIFSSNADFVGEAIGRLRVCLEQLDKDRADPTAFARTFARAAAFREVFRKASS